MPVNATTKSANLECMWLTNPARSDPRLPGGRLMEGWSGRLGPPVE
jgi:hypothetical protein